MSDKSHIKRKVMIAVMAALSAAAIVVPLLSSLLSPALLQQEAPTPTTTTTSAKPNLTIKPVSVRPVISAFVTTPDKCPPPAIAAPPNEPMKACDITKTAVYELAPEAVRLQLTDVDSFKNPLTSGNIVQIKMTQESAEAFHKFTGEHIDQQAAFIRAGVVVWAPKIPEAIEGQVLQLTGDLTLEQTEEIAKLLRNSA